MAVSAVMPPHSWPGNNVLFVAPYRMFCEREREKKEKKQWIKTWVVVIRPQHNFVIILSTNPKSHSHTLVQVQSKSSNQAERNTPACQSTQHRGTLALSESRDARQCDERVRPRTGQRDSWDIWLARGPCPRDRCWQSCWKKEWMESMSCHIKGTKSINHCQICSHSPQACD